MISLANFPYFAKKKLFKENLENKFYFSSEKRIRHFFLRNHEFSFFKAPKSETNNLFNELLGHDGEF